jgi:hypothetical protein
VNIAYLHLVHEEPAVLGRAITKLASANAHSFIHVDCAAPQRPFEETLPKTGVTLLDVRYPINWGGFSMMRATFHLLRAALEDKRSFRRFVLLSGTCYPCFAAETIERTLLENDTEFILVEGEITADHYKHAYYYALQFPDLDVLARRPKEAKGALGDLVTGVVQAALSKIAKPIPLTYPVYAGYQFWALTRECVDYCVRTLRDDIDLKEFFEFSLVPDEALFQTLIMASMFADRVSVSQIPGRGKTGRRLHYVDWKNPGANGQLPRVLDETDYSKILNSEALFARKVTVANSLALMDLLDKRPNDV